MTGLLMLPALAIAIVGMIVDQLIIAGATAWLKPAKFTISIPVYVFPLAWDFTLIPEWLRARRVVGWATTIAMVLELTIIDLAGLPRNDQSLQFRHAPRWSLFTIMGPAIVVQTLTSVAVATAFWRRTSGDRALGWTVRLRISITIIGALSGAPMTRLTATQLAAAWAGQPMPIIGPHSIGAPDGGPGLPGTGWSTEHGDLRTPHFMGLDALRVSPLIAFTLSRQRLSTDARVRMT